MTPLTSLKALPDSLRDELRIRGIVSCQQLYSLLLMQGADLRVQHMQLFSDLTSTALNAIRKELDQIIPEEQRVTLTVTSNREQKTGRPMGVFPPELRPDLHGEVDGEQPLVEPQPSSDHPKPSNDVRQKSEPELDQDGQDKEPRQCD